MKEEMFFKWEKWIDPFVSDDDENKSPYYNSNESYVDDDEDDNFSSKKIKTASTGQFIVGPMGFIPINENNSPSKVYNFWMLHTNFDLTKEAVEAINFAEGVETLDIFTRYRARIAFGKCFDEYHVKDNVETVLRKYYEKFYSQNMKIDFIKSKLINKYSFWCIIINDKNKIFTFGSTNQEEVKDKINEYSDSIKKVYVSWE